MDLLKDGYFRFKLHDSNTSAFAGNFVVIEVVNLLADQFRHKPQTFEQAIDQSNSIDILHKQQQKFDELARALLHSKFFKNKKRLFANEFSCDNIRTLNSEVLKTNWYPGADFFIRGSVEQNKSYPMSSITTAEFTELPKSELPIN